MYRLIMGSLLRLSLTVDPQASWLHFAPCLPVDWREHRVEMNVRSQMVELLEETDE